jgi:hypothetical protein
MFDKAKVRSLIRGFQMKGLNGVSFGANGMYRGE